MEIGSSIALFTHSSSICHQWSAHNKTRKVTHKRNHESFVSFPIHPDSLPLQNRSDFSRLEPQLSHSPIPGDSFFSGNSMRESTSRSRSCSEEGNRHSFDPIQTFDL